MYKNISTLNGLKCPGVTLPVEVGLQSEMLPPTGWPRRQVHRSCHCHAPPSHSLYVLPKAGQQVG